MEISNLLDAELKPLVVYFISFDLHYNFEKTTFYHSHFMDEQTEIQRGNNP